MRPDRFEDSIALTFDDVLLVPRKSDVIPSGVDLKTRLSRNISLKIPLMSSPMDTVTSSSLAIALAREGGIGIIHRNLPVDKQCQEVAKVKRSESWMIRDPITLNPEDQISKAKRINERMGISSFPVVEDGKIVGILTARDLRFKKEFTEKVRDCMTKDPVTIPEKSTMGEAFRIMEKNKIEKLPVIDSHGMVKGLITIRDIEKSEKFPNASIDREGKLLVGAAVGPFDMDRAKALIDSGADILTIDTAHGHSDNVLNMVKSLKKAFDIDMIAGNVSTGQGTEDLISAGADVVKVGMGPGSICTTRVVAGSGVPQITAIQECSEAADQHGIPIIGDGGLKFSGDIAKAIAAGASVVMTGSLFAGTDESPGDVVFFQGRKYKKYRGMGSIGAMKDGSKDRYNQKEVTSQKLVPEGVEGIVPYRGSVAEIVYQLMGGLRSAMGYSGCRTIEELRKNARFVRITKAALNESHPHDIHITEGVPNYWARGS